MKGLTLIETVPQAVIVSSQPTYSREEKIVPRRTIVYETRTDPIVIRLAAERLKGELFIRFGFLKPRPHEVQLVSIEKYYEPYVLVSGSYLIDYYRKCTHLVEIDKEVLEVILLDRTLKPEPPADLRAGGCRVIKLEGEERLKNEVRCSLILDKLGEEVTAKMLPSAPSESYPDKILEQFGVKELAQDADVEILRNRIVKRPAYVNRLIREVFEINERAVIYTPRFRVTYSNIKTGEEKIMEFDGVTAQLLAQRKRTQSRNDLPNPPPPPPL